MPTWTASVGKGFVPDGIGGNQEQVICGDPYHFVEVKGWEYLSDTANIEKMIDYIEDNGGSIDAVLGSGLHPKRETILSGPLNRRLMDVVNKNQAK